MGGPPAIAGPAAWTGCLPLPWPSTTSFGFETSRPKRYDGERTGPDDRRSAGSRTPRGSPSGPPLDRVENNSAVVIRFFSSLLGGRRPLAPQREEERDGDGSEEDPDGTERGDAAEDAEEAEQERHADGAPQEPRANDVVDHADRDHTPRQ